MYISKLFYPKQNQRMFNLYNWLNITMQKEIIYIFIGGGLGSICRYLITEITPKYYKKDFPLGTFIANIIGCFVIGALFATISSNTNLSALLITGFCGGFTTFSSFSKEVFQFLHNKKLKLAFIYVITSSIFGIFAVLSGYWIMEGNQI